MTEPRLKSKLWVQATLRQSEVAGRSGAVLRKGDADAGGVLAVLRGRDGMVVLSQTRTLDGAPAWRRATGDTPVDQASTDAYIERQLGYDTDLWVIELDAPDLQPPFAANIVP